MTSQQWAELESQLHASQRQTRVLLVQNGVLRALLREGVALLQDGAPADGVRVYLDKLERSL